MEPSTKLSDCESCIIIMLSKPGHYSDVALAIQKRGEYQISNPMDSPLILGVKVHILYVQGSVKSLYWHDNVSCVCVDKCSNKIDMQMTYRVMLQYQLTSVV